MMLIVVISYSFTNLGQYFIFNKYTIMIFFRSYCFDFFSSYIMFILWHIVYVNQQN